MLVAGLIIIVVVVAVIALLVTRTTTVQPASAPGSSDTAEQAAAQSLEILRTLVTQENFESFGFMAPGDVSTAELGSPLPVFHVRLDTLQAYKPGETDPDSLLVELNKRIYPVTVGDDIRSAVTVEQSASGWTGTEFGGVNFVSAAEQYRRAESDFIVQVPALNLYFVAERSDAGLMLTPLVDDARFDLKAGEPVAADALFTTILPAAQAAEDLPS